MSGLRKDTPEYKAVQEAIAKQRTPAKYNLNERSVGRLEGIENILYRVAKESARHSPHEFQIPRHGGKRTAEDQHSLYKKKRSQKDGYKKRSYHQTGRAFDFYIMDDEGQPTWSKKYYEKYREVANHILFIAEHIFDIKLDWGGDWDGDGIPVWEDDDERFVDVPHIQMPKQ
jgi:peptidoglycan L-alanyl-D-glutamate endopeptidase CwlK